MVTFYKGCILSWRQDRSAIDDLIGIGENLEGKCVVIIEDIIDTGLSMIM